MYSFSPQSSVYQTTKCYTTYGTMSHVDTDQLPTKGKPWSSILSRDFLHRVDILVPERCCQAVYHRLCQERSPPKFARVITSLGSILQGDFFQEYIKKGKILMRSRGRLGADDVFAIQKGILTMHLDRETYERAGLVGVPYGAKGKRGLKPRWIVKLDLNSPSMVRGKKGYDRLIYACKNVFTSELTWLFFPAPDPLDAFSPINLTATPTLTRGPSPVLCPPLSPPNTILAVDGVLPDAGATTISGDQRAAFEEFAAETYEWLALVRLDSPRLEAGDDVDPFLAKYRVPGGGEESGAEEEADGEQTESASQTRQQRRQVEDTVCRITWEGFLSPEWAHRILAEALAATGREDNWVSFSAVSFGRSIVPGADELTVLRPPGRVGEYILWDVQQGGEGEA